MSDDKQSLRTQLRDRTRAIPDEQRRLADSELTRRVLTLPAVERAETVLAFYGVGTEIDTLDLLSGLLAAGKTLCLPRCEPGGFMEAVTITSLNQLTDRFFGIPQPGREMTPLSPEQLDLVLVPGVAFDRHGYRMGQGGGYYDRYLPKLRGHAVGLCRSALLVDQLPREAHDQPVHVIVTESETIDLEA